MMRSRVTLASTLAAATDEHLRSALIIVVTGGVATPVLVGEGEQADVLRRGEPVVVAVEDDEVGSDAGRGRGRGTPASRSAAMMPTSSISSALACPTAWATAHRSIRGTIRSRACGARSLESLTPCGAVRQPSSMTTTPDGDRARERATADLVHAGEHPVAVALQGPLDAQAAGRRGPVAVTARPPRRARRRRSPRGRRASRPGSAATRPRTARPVMSSIGTEPSRPCRRGRGSGSPRSPSGGRP